MMLWRVSRHRELAGAGGLRAPGRWHERGMPVVYLAESPAGALLESCIHTSANDIPPHYILLGIEVNRGVSQEDVDAGSFPADWINRLDVTRKIGTTWLREQRSCLLRIPSALAPATFNVMLNPLHRDAARLRIVSTVKYPFDPRIKK
jgi:RES domain-containing protein